MRKAIKWVFVISLMVLAGLFAMASTTIDETGLTTTGSGSYNTLTIATNVQWIEPNNGTAIQAAINGCGESCEINIPPGTYDLASLNLCDNTHQLTLRGSGVHKTILNHTGTGNFVTCENASQNRLIFTDMTLYANNGTFDTIYLDAGCENCEFKNLRLDSQIGNSTGAAIHIDHAVGLGFYFSQIDNIYIRRAAIGILINSTTGSFANSNVFNNIYIKEVTGTEIWSITGYRNTYSNIAFDHYNGVSGHDLMKLDYSTGYNTIFNIYNEGLTDGDINVTNSDNTLINIMPTIVNTGTDNMIVDDSGIYTDAIIGPSSGPIAVTGNVSFDVSTFNINADGNTVGVGTKTPTTAKFEVASGTNDNVIMLGSSDAKAYIHFKDSGTSVTQAFERVNDDLYILPLGGSAKFRSANGSYYVCGPGNDGTWACS